MLIAILVLLLLSPLLIGLLFYGTPTEYLQRRAFDSASWKDQQETNDDGRLRMVDDLVDNVLAPGMKRSEVVDLLGPPDETAYFSNWDMVYFLGKERSFFSIDSEWLVIRLDSSGEVVEFRVVAD